MEMTTTELLVVKVNGLNLKVNFIGLYEDKRNCSGTLN